MTNTLAGTTLRIEKDASLIVADNLNPTNEQVRQYSGDGMLSHISPMILAFRALLHEQVARLATIGGHLVA